jgi:hypothetical protein
MSREYSYVAYIIASIVAAKNYKRFYLVLKLDYASIKWDVDLPAFSAYPSGKHALLPNNSSTKNSITNPFLTIR